MKNLLESELFHLLDNYSSEKEFAKKLKSAYEDFALKLLDTLQSETNATKLYYNLGFVRLELAELRDSPFGEKGKKCLKVYY